MENVMQTTEKGYKMRRLEARDIVPMVKILSKIGLNELSTCIRWEEVNRLRTCLKDKEDTEKKETEDTETVPEAKGTEPDDPWIIGATIALDVANKVLENLPACMNDVYTLLSSVTGLEKEEIASMDLEEFAELVIAFVKKEEFKGFIGVASRFIR